jgi:hypothetical protein
MVVCGGGVALFVQATNNKVNGGAWLQELPSWASTRTKINTVK